MQELARYDGTLNSILNPAVLLSPITLREAELSSRIEGTQVTLIEVLKHEAGDKEGDAEKKKDIKEIINYRLALLYAEQYLQDRPVTLHLIRELHAILMDSVRGEDKEPGKFRNEQNFIGKKGSTIEQARFIPPDPVTMKHALEKLQILWMVIILIRLCNLQLFMLNLKLFTPSKMVMDVWGGCLSRYFCIKSVFCNDPCFI